MLMAVERVSDDGLLCEYWSWRFAAELCELQLSSYQKLSKPSRRHRKYRLQAFYEQKLDTAKQYRNRITDVEDVPVPADVAREILDRFVNHLRVVKRANRNEAAVVLLPTGAADE